MKANEEAIFQQALSIDSEEERRGYLRGACGGDAELYDRVQSLLRVHFEAEGFLETQIAPADGQQLVEGPGTRIGRYKILQEIGEGGMGVVYMAEQTEPVTRKVALKIIKLGMDTKQVVARFEAERQALAMMDHPNIAKVLDAGATDSGRPYFVMELVRGVPITEYCDKNKLNTKARLQLFIPVCQAIQHAHQKGIIHRDIKPSNVMVTLHDGNAVPKVIDFGIAKATNQKLTEKTLFTNYAHMIGTPAYMSPEQAEMSGLDVDTRTDVYSLGVLLYELLTGTTPFPSKELLSLGYGEMQRVIAETEPPKPSTRMSTMQDEERTTIASRRNIDASAMGQIFQGDLDWIVMRSLEKDRTQRYDTANGLAADVQRHLDNEPVSAAAPTFGYQLKKLYHRHRGYARMAAIVVALLSLAALFSSWQAYRAHKEKNRAIEQTQLAERRQQDLAEATETAENQLYEALVNQANALQEAGGEEGSPENVFPVIKQALELQHDEEDTLRLRSIAMASIGTSPEWRYEERHAPVVDAAETSTVLRSGSEAFVGYRDGTVRLLSVIADTESPVEGRHPASVVSSCRLKSLNLWASVDSDRNLFIWEMDQSSSIWRVIQKQSIDGFSGQPFIVASGTTILAYQFGSSKIQVWQATNLRQIKQLDLPIPIEGWPPLRTGRLPYRFPSIWASPDERWLATTVSDQQSILLYDLKLNKPIGSLSLRHVGRRVPVFSPNGEFLLVHDHSPSELALYDVKTQTKVQSLPTTNDQAYYANFSEDSSQIIYGSYFASTKWVWDYQSNRIVDAVQIGRGSPNFGIDGTLLTFQMGANSITSHLLHPVTKPVAKTIHPHSALVYGVDLSPNGRWLASVSTSQLRVFDLEYNQFQQLSAENPGGGLEDPVFSSDGRLLAVPFVWGDLIRVWDTTTWNELEPLPCPIRPYAIHFHPHDPILAVGANTGVSTWRYEFSSELSNSSPKVEWTKAGFEKPTPGPVRYLRFAPTGNYLAWTHAAHGNSATLSVNNIVKQLTDPTVFTKPGVTEVYGFRFSADGKQIVLAEDLREQTSRNEISVWDLATRKRVNQFDTADDANSVNGKRPFCVSSDGTLALVGSTLSRPLNLYHLPSGKPIGSMGQEGQRVINMAWSKTGNRVAMGMENGDVKIWNINQLREQLDEINLNWED